MLVSGGYSSSEHYNANGKYFDNSHIFSTKLSDFDLYDFKPLTRKNEYLFEVPEKLPFGDEFMQNAVFPLSESLITSKFVKKQVNEEKRAVLLDLKQPRSQLFAVVGRNALHVFDKSHDLWISSDNKIGEFETV